MSTGSNPPAMPAPLDRLARAPVTTFDPPQQKAVTIDPSQFNAEALLAAHTVQLNGLSKSHDELKLELKEFRAEVTGDRAELAKIGWRVLWALAGVALDLIVRGLGYVTIKHP